MNVRSRKLRREALLKTITDFHGAEIQEIYDIICLLSIANTGNRGETYALYRLSNWLDVRWVGHELGSYDLEVQPERATRFARLQVKTAAPTKPWQGRWAFSKIHGGKDPAPYDFLLLLGTRSTHSEEPYSEREEDYAVFIVPYSMLKNDYFSTSRLDLSFTKTSLLQKRSTGNKHRKFYEEFETIFEEAAETISAFCLQGEAASERAMSSTELTVEAIHDD